MSYLFRLQGIKIYWLIQFLEYLRTLSLKFQKARTKIGVVLALPCWLSLEPSSDGGTGLKLHKSDFKIVNRLVVIWHTINGLSLYLIVSRIVFIFVLKLIFLRLTDSNCRTFAAPSLADFTTPFTRDSLVETLFSRPQVNIWSGILQLHYMQVHIQ
jgi:hypothetical protein